MVAIRRPRGDPGAGRGPMTLPVADCHNDLMLSVQFRRDLGHEDPFGAFWLPQLQAGGVELVVLPVYTEDWFIGEGALRRALRTVGSARQMAARHAHAVTLVIPSRWPGVWPLRALPVRSGRRNTPSPPVAMAWSLGPRVNGWSMLALKRSLPPVSGSPLVRTVRRAYEGRCMAWVPA